MTTSKKIKITINGMEYLIRGKALRTTDWNGKPLAKPYVYIGQVEAASILKQYVKQKYPEVMVWAVSDSYSGGCSTRAYISDKYGYPVAQTIYDDIWRFGKMFQMGNFNGMTDSYEYSDAEYKTDSGTELDMSVSYVFVENDPKFDTPQDIAKSLRLWMSGKCTNGQPMSLAEAVDKIKSYHKKENMKEGITLV